MLGIEACISHTEGKLPWRQPEVGVLMFVFLRQILTVALDWPRTYGDQSRLDGKEMDLLRPPKC